MRILNLVALFLTVVALNAQQPVKIACVGNSITYGYGVKDPVKDSYPSQLQRLVGTGFDVHKFGHNSKCAQDEADEPYSETMEYSAALAFQPDIVIIKLGTNDTKDQNWLDAKRYQKGLEKIAKSFAGLQSHPRILLAYPAKAYSRAWSIDDNKIVTEVIPAINRIAKKHKWEVIDLHTATSNMKQHFPDGIHPDAFGYELIAKTVRDAILNDPHRPQVTLTTDFGDIVVELFNETPLHRDNFLKQVRNKSFNGVLWHRVINQFIIQTGDRLSKNAKPGEMLGEGDETPEDWIPAEFRAPLFYHQRGMLNAAREGEETNPEKKSSSTQFTIVTGRTFDDAALDNTQKRIDEWTNGQFKLTPEMRNTYKTIGGAPHLDGSYTVFGRVVSGMDVVEKIEKLPTDQNDRPIHDVHIIKAKITKK